MSEHLPAEQMRNARAEALDKSRPARYSVGLDSKTGFL